MRIIVAHNYYQQRGGECLSFEANASLLESHGHEVHRFTVHNDEINQQSKLKVAIDTIWNRQMRKTISQLVHDFRPDVVHFTNTFPRISPSVYSAVRSSGAAVVQDLRNYRLVCAAFNFLRDGKICEDCVGRSFAFPAIRHRCYRDSRAGSAVVASMQAIHRFMGTWQSQVNLFLTPSEFAREKYIESGFDANQIKVKPNFIDPIPDVGLGKGGFAIFVGRLSSEKGISTLLDAWKHLKAPIDLRFVGDGEQKCVVEEAAKQDPRIQLLGWKSHEELLRLIGEARVLIMPSLWYETFGRTIIEAYAKGCPVIASRLGSMQELVQENVTGLLCDPGDARQIASAVEQMHQLSDESYQSMRQAARDEFIRKFTSHRNYEIMIDAYQHALRSSSSRDNTNSGHVADHNHAKRKPLAEVKP